MGHFLNFGAGPNQLPAPWQNLNAEHDIRKPLQFEDASAQLILAEHVIEHAQFSQGYGFLSECVRVLAPGGVLRLGFPDVSRFVRSEESGFWFNARALKYARALADSDDAGAVVRGARRDANRFTDKVEREHMQAQYACRAATLCVLAGYNHLAMWTRDGAAAALLSAGFKYVREQFYGRSGVRELVNVDGHAKDVGDEIALLETTILEAEK